MNAKYWILERESDNDKDTGISISAGWKKTEWQKSCETEFLEHDDLQGDHLTTGRISFQARTKL